MDNYCIAQAAQSCVATWMGGETGEDGHMYMYSWAPLLFTWNYHNIANWLYYNIKFKVS